MLDEFHSYHHPVLLRESLEGLNIRPEGIYVDATFGGGGHSRAILEKLSTGRLIAFDQDDDARQVAETITHRSFTFCHANFRYLKRFLDWHGVNAVHGILADLGVSSHQFDEAARGFSIRHEGPLDMRMDTRNPLTAARIVNEYHPDELQRVLSQYGEVRNARTLALAIAAQRTQAPIGTTARLVDILRPFAPKKKENQYFAQVFQALRIEVNDELKALEDFLHQAGEVLVPGGRLVVLSYHSLEDRIIKNYINKGTVWGEPVKDMYGNVLKTFKAVNRKPIVPDEKEIQQNNRARSAKLRIAEKI
ncbi:MAG: 16S rRNA (cytosine(1402)-N(4))-methyltransferase RsmH [Cyclobacteriaceae bacterium]|nr:16S rRNA (cytosine(1402)-N(4))-methyltransferase RsmH [Cyclobacteriaceae bacterium]